MSENQRKKEKKKKMDLNSVLSTLIWTHVSHFHEKNDKSEDEKKPLKTESSLDLVEP